MALLKHYITLSDKRLVWSLGGEFLVLLLENWDAVIKCIPIFFCKEYSIMKFEIILKNVLFFVAQQHYLLEKILTDCFTLIS